MDVNELIEHGVPKQLIDKLLEDKIARLTSVQEKVINLGLCSGENILVCSPTSTGKTLIAEIAAVVGALSGRKCVYLLTHKALAEEKYSDFINKYSLEGDKWFDVSIATGDRQEGDWKDGILIATYEKFLSYIAGVKQNIVSETIIVADEIQILGDGSRGHDIEVLCTLIMKSNPYQFVGLSATLKNADILSEWLNCKLIEVNYRDVPLRQEVWYGQQSHCKYHGSDEISSIVKPQFTSNTLDAVKYFVENNLSPVLVFTMTKRQASDLASAYAESRQINSDLLDVSEQLDLFAEPTSLTNILRSTSQRGVAFHSTDLTFEERSVIEKGLRTKQIDVVFATPTLAAGVNFPIRTVLFDSYHRYWDMPPSYISKHEYRNMSGRAGRLGFHEEGLAVLKPENHVQYHWASEYLSEKLDPLESNLFKKSLRKSLLYLFSSGICNSTSSANDFFQLTLWYYYRKIEQSEAINVLPKKIDEAIEWLLNEKLLIEQNSCIETTEFGSAIAVSGLLPQTAVSLIKFLKAHESSFFRNYDSYLLDLLLAVCNSDEFNSEEKSRWLPFANDVEDGARAVLVENQDILLENVENYNADVINASFILKLWSEGLSEKQLRRNLRQVMLGIIQELSSNVAWVLEGISKITATVHVNLCAPLPSRLGLLSKCVRYGVPAEGLDVIESAKVGAVPGLGRERTMKLVNAGICEPNVILKTPASDLESYVDSVERAKMLQESIRKRFETPFQYWEHRQISSEGIDENQLMKIRRSYEVKNNDYEDIVLDILNDIEISSVKFDTDGKIGAPDIMINYDNIKIALDCKTKQDDDATINTADAFHVLIKASDLKKDHCVTIGKPAFNSHSKSKASASPGITLISHKDFIEAAILVWKGIISKDDFYFWFKTPGVADYTILANNQRGYLPIY